MSDEYKKEHKEMDGIGMTIAEYEEAISKLTEDNKGLKKKVNELTALLYRLTDQFENDFFTYSSAFMNNQNISRNIKQRLAMTPEVWDIVNKSKQTPEDSVNS